MLSQRKTALLTGGKLSMGQELPACPAAEQSLCRLLMGNRRYRQEERNHAPLTELIRITTTEEGQHPYAVVICCADSRVPPEHIFHAGLGELFVIRNAGNLMTPAALGSVEYAVAHLHVPLILVMGHRGCGAVASALVHGQSDSHAEEGALGDLIAQVAAAIGTVRSPAQAEEHNLRSSLAGLSRSPVLKRLALEGRVGIAGAMYDIRSGAVTLL